MNVFELAPVSLPTGAFAAAWFDDDACTWDDARLHKADPLERGWEAPQLHLHRPSPSATPVLFNPNAVAVSDAVRSELSAFGEIEFLPVQIAEHGTYFILHVVASIEIPKGCAVSQPSLGSNPGNVVLVHSFPPTFRSEHAFFRLLQPADSPAGRQRFCTRASYLSPVGRDAIESACAGFLHGKPL